jgi:hypothetical protein
MATKKRTTQAVSEDFKALRVALRASKQNGESAARPTYRAMDDTAKRAFVRSRAR